MSYHWEIDNTIRNTSQFNHTFNNGGYETVKLLLEDANGCKDSVREIIQVNSFNVDFSFSGNCSNEPTAFLPDVESNFSTNVNFEWHFPDDIVSDDHIYYVLGTTSSVTLIGTDEYGCTSSESKTVLLNHPPSVAFSSTALCEGEIVSFINESTTPIDSISNVNWYIDNNFESSDYDFTHSFESSGESYVRLEAENINGCIESVVERVWTYSNPRANFIVLNDSVCKGTASLFFLYGQAQAFLRP